MNRSIAHRSDVIDVLKPDTNQANAGPPSFVITVPLQATQSLVNVTSVYMRPAWILGSIRIFNAFHVERLGT